MKTNRFQFQKDGPVPNTKADAADLIREMRRRLGLSQEKLAQRLKVSFPTINRWENRKTKPDAMAWHIIEQFLLSLGNDYADLHARYFAGGEPQADRGAAARPAKQGRGRRKAKAENGASLPSANGNRQVLGVKSMETMLWKAACSIRGEKDAPKFKDYILPLVFIKHAGLYDQYFLFMSVFVFAFIGSFMFYLFSQKDVYKDWRRRLFLFPVFMAGSMGLAVNNTRAVVEGLLRKKSEFVRTPKYSIRDKNDSWFNKKYVPVKISPTVIVELLLAVYCLFGVASSIYFLEIAAVPFQMLFFLGFAFVSIMSIKHARFSRKMGAAQ